MDQLLSSMERQIQQMASLTEIFNLLASPETSAEDCVNLEQRFEKLKARHAS
jgi:septation ring formation regulator EzrA